jgi:hypothetical protein
MMEGEEEELEVMVLDGETAEEAVKEVRHETGGVEPDGGEDDSKVGLSGEGT